MEADRPRRSRHSTRFVNDKLTWRRTWPDEEGRKAEDWTVSDGTTSARVYLTVDEVRWYWVVNREKLIASGLEDSREEAMARARESWER